MKLKYFIFLFLITPHFALGQTTQQSDTLFFSQTIIDYSIDATGSIFLSFEEGSITKYSSALDSLFTYSPTKLGNTKLLESGTGLVIFAFYDFFQEYLITDRFLARPTRTKLSNTSIDYIDIATQSLDNNIWLVENTEFRLIKYNVSFNRIEIEIPLNTIIDNPDNDFSFIKEYQNQVFLVDKNKGIYVFDNLGNFSKLIIAKTNKCTFEKNMITYLENGDLINMDIYSNTQERSTITTAGVWGVMKYRSNLYYVKNKSLIRYY
ncbi:MAG: hypothetical protein L3J29_07875 [Cyclobacteriaceae bacterium]|nr:hypothetical protein [Cyclobacteriaceae bacterium]